MARPMSRFPNAGSEPILGERQLCAAKEFQENTLIIGRSANAAVGADSAEWPVSSRLPTLRLYAICTRVEC